MCVEVEMQHGTTHNKKSVKKAITKSRREIDHMEQMKGTERGALPTIAGCVAVFLLAVLLLGSGASSATDGLFDFEYELYDRAEGGVFLGTITEFDTTVSSGVFTAELDFGNSITGAAMWLEIRVREAGGGLFTVLTPRQHLTKSVASACTVDSDLVVNGAIDVVYQRVVAQCSGGAGITILLVTLLRRRPRRQTPFSSTFPRTYNIADGPASLTSRTHAWRDFTHGRLDPG